MSYGERNGYMLNQNYLLETLLQILFTHAVVTLQNINFVSSICCFFLRGPETTTFLKTEDASWVVLTTF